MKQRLLVGVLVALWPVMLVGAPITSTENDRLMGAQESLLDRYQLHLQQLENGPLKLFQLLVSFANHELDTAELVKQRIYSESYPLPVTEALEALQLRHGVALEAASRELNPEALARFKARQQTELRSECDERLMAFVTREVQARDREAQRMLNEIITLVQPEALIVKRIARKQRKLDTALRGVSSAFKRFDSSDHRLSTRVDRIRDFRLERLTLVLAMLAQPADAAIAAAIAAGRTLDEQHQTLHRAQD
ncbi:hypothetical protein [Motiliproteus sediminis]|uniref:hypothetical protein n=1 Tax=Motiliproteus sediminis TaxID=1468178 RepID=UPI001AEF93CF|nr:hypothetical protein [Motiliproteus sediminis]